MIDACSASGFICAVSWVGALTGTAGALALAVKTRFSKWGWLGYLVSNGAWISYGVMTSSGALVFQQIAFSIISVVGIYCWIVRSPIAASPQRSGR